MKKNKKNIFPLFVFNRFFNVFFYYVVICRIFMCCNRSDFGVCCSGFCFAAAEVQRKAVLFDLVDERAKKRPKFAVVSGHMVYVCFVVVAVVVCHLCVCPTFPITFSSSVLSFCCILAAHSNGRDRLSFLFFCKMNIRTKKL